MSETIASTDRSAGRECPKCAETVAEDDIACSFCGFPVTLRKSPLVRLGEVASLAVVLAIIIAICRGIGLLLGV